MTMTEGLGPTIPFHIAKAYGVAPQARVQPLAKAPSLPPATQEAMLFHPQGGTKANPGVARLVAATVPGRVDFSGDEPRPSRDVLSMYRHPADRNAAATGIQAGRMLDVKG
ncbi:MAG: hypothetical protein KIT24_05745 [Phycisphaeraceae bacterium]|nr:hypothetical protein [Phycisphaeraceae bacterium]